MQEINQKLAENLHEFLLCFSDDVIRGLRLYTNKTFS